MANNAQTQPVTLYAEDPRLPRTLARDLQQRIAQKSEAIASGMCSSFEEYKERIGELRGLREALVICQDAEKNLSGS